MLRYSNARTSTKMFRDLVKIVLILSSEIVVISHGQSRLPASCVVPPASADKTLTITDINGDPLANANPGSRVPKGATIDFKCARGYVFSDGTDSASSFCRPTAKGEWQPAIKPCIRFCPRLNTSNVALTCKYNGRDVDCDGSLLSGTVVTPKCRDLHHVSGEFNPDYTTIRCRLDGTWSRRLFKCDPDCGIPKHETLILGGANATLGQFPWHVAIYSMRKNNLLICGGTLIASNVVVSAAHCFYNESFGVPMAKPSDYMIAVGKVTRNYDQVDNEVQKMVEISEILFADKPYNPKANGYTADIAMIILKERVQVNTYVLPACFRSYNNRLGFVPAVGTKGVLAGWGVGENGRPTENLRTIEIPFIPYDECVKKLSGITHDRFCAGTDRGARPLTGDSGGGLIFKDPSTPFYYVRGIVSTTERFSELAVTTFTDISYYQEWIDRIIQERFEDEQREEAPKIVETQTTAPVVSQCCLAETSSRRALRKRDVSSRKWRPQSRNSTSSNSVILYGQEVILNSMTNLMLKLNKILSKCFTSDDNVLFAPFNIAKSFSVIMLGTGGQTEVEMSNAIGPGLQNRPLKNNTHEFHSGMSRLLRNILAVPPGPTVSRDMVVASGMFIDDSIPVKQVFKDLAMKYYRTEVHNMNFKGDSRGSTDFMNQWIHKKTFGGIKESVIQSPISPTTKLMFTCAVFFNGEWEHPFHVKNTKWQTFNLKADGEGGSVDKILVEMMTNRAKVMSYKNEEMGFRVVGLPFKGGNVIMYVVLPELETSLERLLCQLGPDEIEDIISGAQPAHVVYTFPKMKIHYRSDTRYALQQLNTTSLFDPHTANFRNLSDTEGAYMSDMVQAVYVDLNETYSAAPAAATAPAVKLNPGDIDFRVDRPFVFFMYNINVGIITFWGSVKRPTPFRKIAEPTEITRIVGKK